MSGKQTCESVTDLLVGQRGGTMHFGRLIERPSASFSPTYNGATLCGRTMIEPHAYPLGEQNLMPWPLCQRCEAAHSGSSESGP